MARDSSGTKNQPQYLGTGAPATAADQNEIANYAADVGNRKVKTAAERAALSGADVWDGLEVFESDTGRAYLRISGGWKRTADKLSLCVVEKDIAQNTSAGTVTVTWNSTGAAIDTDSYYSTGTNTRVTVPFTGIYEVTYKARIASTQALTSDLKINGVSAPRGASSDVGASGAASCVAATVLLSLAAGDYLTLDITATGASALATTGGTFMSAEYLGQV
jgi:hypothetical protein